MPGCWNPDANCGGSRAEDRMRWLMDNKGMRMTEAQDQVMSEFINEFLWNPNANCGGIRAEDRMRWLIDNQHKSVDDAKAQVRHEFPDAFPQPDKRQWNPNADCGGSRAEDRMRWVVDNQRKSPHDAQEQIMKEFPQCFALARPPHRMWAGGANCSGHSADDRAKWLVDNQHIGWREAQFQVMHEFPTAFPEWSPNANCGGIPAQDRVRWLIDNKHMSEYDAQEQVMQEHPGAFNKVIPPHLAEGFCHALQDEYLHGRGNAVGDWFNSTGDSGMYASLLDPYEARVRDAGDKRGELERVQEELHVPHVCIHHEPPPSRPQLQRCFRCEGRGFQHDSTMNHDASPDQRCFFCKDCNTCHKTGTIPGNVQRCFKCEGHGYVHESSMNHDKPRGVRCFFCRDCTGCRATGMIS